MKLGLVLEGGASRTVFSCGVMDVLLEEGIKADYIIGTSAGISYGVSYASGQYERNLKITKQYMSDKRYMGMRHLINRKTKCFYNMDFVFDEIPNKLIPFDYDAFEKFSGGCKAVVTDIETGLAEYLEVDRHDVRWNVLRATCSLPILFPVAEINGKKYLDGGISDSVAYQKAFADGCDKVIVVLTRERGYVKKTDMSVRLACALYGKYQNLCASLLSRAEVYNSQINRLRKLEAEGKAFVIEPFSTMGVGRTDKAPQKLIPLYAHGKEVMNMKLDALKKYIEE